MLVLSESVTVSVRLGFGICDPTFDSSGVEQVDLAQDPPVVLYRARNNVKRCLPQSSIDRSIHTDSSIDGTGK